MANFKLLNMRRRMATMKGIIPGVPGQVQTLEGIELILDYIPKNVTGITPQEEEEVLKLVNERIQTTKGTPFIILNESEDAPAKDEKTSSESTTESQDEASVWKAKYEAAESKRRGLQLKVNEYKKKLIKAGIITDESGEVTTTEGGANTKGAKASKPSRGKGSN